MSDYTPYLTKPPKRYLCDRLFGGAFHRKRRPVEARHWQTHLGLSFTSLRRPPMNVYGQPDFFDPTPVTAYDVHTYTWRRVAFGRDKLVTFLAEDRLSDEEACDLFYNWLLKRAGITEESGRIQP